jgi:PhnB protein
MATVEPRGLVPHLTIEGAAQAIDYYKKALGAEELMRMPHKDGKRLMHAHLRIGESDLMLADDFPEYHGGKSSSPKALGATPVVLHQTVANCDAAIQRCADAGGKVTMPPQDMFWGDRYGQVTDPFGHVWSFSTPLKK